MSPDKASMHSLSTLLRRVERECERLRAGLEHRAAVAKGAVAERGTDADRHEAQLRLDATAHVLGNLLRRIEEAEAGAQAAARQRGCAPEACSPFASTVYSGQAREHLLHARRVLRAWGDVSARSAAPIGEGRQRRGDRRAGEARVAIAADLVVGRAAVVEHAPGGTALLRLRPRGRTVAVRVWALGEDEEKEEEEDGPRRAAAGTSSSSSVTDVLASTSAVVAAGASERDAVGVAASRKTPLAHRDSKMVATSSTTTGSEDLDAQVAAEIAALVKQIKTRHVAASSALTAHNRELDSAAARLAGSVDRTRQQSDTVGRLAGGNSDGSGGGGGGGAALSAVLGVRGALLGALWAMWAVLKHVLLLLLIAGVTAATLVIVFMVPKRLV